MHKSYVDLGRCVLENKFVTGQVDGPELATVRGFAFEA